MSNCKPDVRGKDEPVKRTQSDSAFTPREGPLRLVRPTHGNAAKNKRDATGRAQRQCCFEGLDRGGPIVLDQRYDEPGQAERRGVVAAIAPSRDRAAGILTETAALAEELHNIVENDRYTFSPRIGTLARRLSRSALAS